jgi:SagB-type dehydrogenase family enzyme
MKNSKDVLRDLVSEIGLSNIAYDYIEKIKYKKFHILSNNFNKKIPLVNGYHVYKDMITNGTFEIGNIEKSFKIKSNLNSKERDTFVGLMDNRKSIRQYSKNLNKEELFDLLKTSYYINKKNGKRNIASGGATYPIEMFYLNINTTGIPKGIYHYNLKKKSLDLIKSKTKLEVTKLLKDGFLTNYKSDMDYHKASGVIFLVGFMNRASFKYEDFAVKLTYIDSGAILHSLYLTSSLLNIKSCACGGYDDSVFEKELELKASYQNIVSTFIIGK